MLNDENKFSVWGTILLNLIDKSGKYDYSTNGLGVVLGAEFGIWAGYNVGVVDLQLKYDVRLRSDFVNHIGTLSFKYVF